MHRALETLPPGFGHAHKWKELPDGIPPPATRGVGVLLSSDTPSPAPGLRSRLFADSVTVFRSGCPDCGEEAPTSALAAPLPPCLHGQPLLVTWASVHRPLQVAFRSSRDQPLPTTGTCCCSDVRALSHARGFLICALV